MANLNVTIPAVKLNDGNSIPMLGYGVGTAWGKKEEGKVDQAIIDGVKTAIKLGYYHLDGAECKCCRGCPCINSLVTDRFVAYKNETELGQAIKDSGVDRSKLFVTTKIWEPTGQTGDIERALKESLKKLQLDYVDLWVLLFVIFYLCS